MNIEGLYERDGIFYTLMNDFSEGYHTYPEYELIYDAIAQEFYLGGKLNEEASNQNEMEFSSNDQSPKIDNALSYGIDLGNDGSQETLSFSLQRDYTPYELINLYLDIYDQYGQQLAHEK